MLLTPLQASRLSLPQARVRVKWSNPLTRGLIFALVPGVGLVNLVTGEVATYSAGVSVTPSPGGKAARFTGDTAVRLQFPLSVGSGSFSLFTKVKLNSNASALPLGLFRVGGSPLATGNYLGVEASTQIVATSTELDNWNSAGGPNAVTGATYSLGASFTSGGGRVLYIGGNAAASSGTARAVTGLNRILVGVYQGGNKALYSPLNGDSEISLVWNRVLTADEHAAVFANPSALLEADDLDLEPYYLAGGGTSPVNSDLAASYAIRGAAQQDISASYTIRAAVAQDIAASYSIRGAVVQDLAASYVVQGSVAQDLAASYAIRAAVQQDLAATFDIRGSAQQSLTGEYAVRGSVQSDFSAAYNIENAGVVLSDFSAAYAVLGSAQRDLDADYSVQQSVSADQAATYVVRGSVQTSLVGAYDVLGQVASDLTASWTIPGSVARNFTANYTISGSGGVDPGAVWGYLLSNGLTAEQTILRMAQQIDELHRIHGLQIDFPLQTTDSSRSAGDISQSVSDDGTATTVQRL